MTQAVMDARLKASDQPGPRLLQLDAEEVVVLARHLALSDRMLVQNVYERGLSAADLARAMDVSPDAVRKRLRRVVRLLASPLFRFVVWNKHRWPDETRVIAEHVVLRGHSHRTAARLLNITKYRVRCEVERVRIMSERR